MSGNPVDHITDLVIIGAVKIAKGAIQFTKWAAEMTPEFGPFRLSHQEVTRGATGDNGRLPRCLSVTRTRQVAPPAMCVISLSRSVAPPSAGRVVATPQVGKWYGLARNEL